jgi:diketogulonate reductase-like aldo/keto reductase
MSDVPRALPLPTGRAIPTLGLGVFRASGPDTRGAVAATASRLRRTPAQVVLRWGLEQGLVVLPKSVRPERIAENGDLWGWTLDDDARATLDGLDQGLATGWDPRGET